MAFAYGSRLIFLLPKSGNLKRPARKNVTNSNCLRKNLVPEPTPDQISETLQFSRFRFKLIEFLKLPPNIREPQFRDVLERTSCAVHSNYLARAERVKNILKSEDASDFEDTAVMSVRVPLIMDLRQLDSVNP